MLVDLLQPRLTYLGSRKGSGLYAVDLKERSLSFLEY